MKRVSVVSLSATAAIAAVWMVGKEEGQCAAPEKTVPAAPAAGDAMLARQPIAFVPNLGQWEHPARFVARTGGTSVFLEERGFLLAAVERPARPEPKELWPHEAPAEEELRGAAVRLAFANAETPELVPERMLAGHHDYFLGNDPSRWRTEVPLYGAVRYRGAWPGVDVLCYAVDGHLEYDVVVAPGGDLQAVELEVEGGEGLSIDADGALVIGTAIGPIRQPRPHTYTLDATGARRPLAARYEVRGTKQFGFAVPDWYGEEVLVVDPGVIWSTYIGGPDSERPYSLYVDDAGIVTITGQALGIGFPTTTGAWNPTYSGGRGLAAGDVFVSRLDPSRAGAQQLVYSTYLGGGHVDEPAGLHVDSAGLITIAGRTVSVDFPTTQGAWDTTYNGGLGDVFIARLDPAQPSMQQLVYSTFLGGRGADACADLFADASGVVTIVGLSGGNYPTTANAWSRTSRGADVVVTMLDPSRPTSQQLVYSTFVSGRAIDEASAVHVDAMGVVTFAGRTDSSDYPTTPGAWDPSHNFDFDGFVTRLDPSLPPSQQIVYSTFLGGRAREALVDMSVDPWGVVTVVGATGSNDFPTTPSAFMPAFNANGDVYLTRLDPSRPASRQIVYSSFLGGNGRDMASGLSVGPVGIITVSGVTSSTDFPTTRGAWDVLHNQAWDTFVTALDPSRTGPRQLVYSTFLGSVQPGWMGRLWSQADGSVTVVGYTGSPTHPTTQGAWSTTFLGGVTDGFVTRLDMLPTGVTRFGASSPGCNGPLAIGVTSMPNVGNQAFSITCTNAPPNTSGWLLGSSGRLTTPLPIGGAFLWLALGGVSGVTGSVQSNGVGAAEFALPIPATPSLAGFRLYTQFAWLGPSAPAPCPSTGVSASAALEIVVQP